MNKRPSLHIVSTPEQVRAAKAEASRAELNRELGYAIEAAKSNDPNAAWQLVFHISQIFIAVTHIIRAETST